MLIISTTHFNIAKTLKEKSNWRRPTQEKGKDLV